MEAQLAEASANLAKDPKNSWARTKRYVAEYNYSKYVRRDNTPEYAKYLGYLDARELYPDFKPKDFREFVVELLDGKIKAPYGNRVW